MSAIRAPLEGGTQDSDLKKLHAAMSEASLILVCRIHALPSFLFVMNRSLMAQE
jgi:hypothetical protein